VVGAFGTVGIASLIGRVSRGARGV